MRSKQILMALGILVAAALFFAPAAKAQINTVQLQCVVLTETGNTGMEMFLDTNSKTGFYAVQGQSTTLPLVWNIVGEWLFVAMTERSGPVLVVLHATQGTGKSYMMMTEAELNVTCREVKRGNA